MSDPQQLADNINTFNAPVMTAEEKAAVDAAAKAIQSDIIIPCTACNYCDECPSGIKIPEIFKMYNVAASKGFHHIWGSLSGQYYGLETTKGTFICKSPKDG
jgi:predicted aldo/keto reductase-like oxidoreductase